MQARSVTDQDAATPTLVEAGPLALSGISRRSANLRPFRKGQSGNPAGRPKGSAGLAAYIRSQTRDGREMVDGVLGILRQPAMQDPKLRLEAATWLANRAFGTPVQSHEVTGADGETLTFTLRLGERDADGG